MHLLVAFISLPVFLFNGSEIAGVNSPDPAALIPLPVGRGA